jgi:hypothetical protein
VEQYVEKALSAFFSSPTSSKPMTTLDVFTEASRLNSRAAKAWLERLTEISENDVVKIFDQIPNDRISDAARRFAMKMLELNQKHLLKQGV